MRVRSANEDDLPRLLDIYNHYIEHTSITFDIEKMSLAQRRVWFDEFDLDDERAPHRLFVAASDLGVAGYASSHTFRSKAAYARSVETSIYLAPEATRAGLGTMLYGHLMGVLEANPNVHRAYAGITVPNDASVRLHERIGFKQVARFGEVGFKFDQYWDVVWFERAV